MVGHMPQTGQDHEVRVRGEAGQRDRMNLSGTIVSASPWTISMGMVRLS
jgi:hypothetical protein